MQVFLQMSEESKIFISLLVKAEISSFIEKKFEPFICAKIAVSNRACSVIVPILTSQDFERFLQTNDYLIFSIFRPAFYVFSIIQIYRELTFLFLVYTTSYRIVLPFLCSKQFFTLFAGYVGMSLKCLLIQSL